MAALANWNAERDYGIPVAARVVYTYVSAGAADDDLIATASYYGIKDIINGVTTYTLLGVLAFEYVGSTNNLESITRTT